MRPILTLLRTHLLQGNYVGRGYYCLETFTYLLLLKARCAVIPRMWFPLFFQLLDLFPTVCQNDLLKLCSRYPDRITLLRGNHESSISRFYGFYDEILEKYGNPTIWKHCCSVFNCLCLAAVGLVVALENWLILQIIENKILCVHAGLSPEISTVDQISKIDR